MGYKSRAQALVASIMFARRHTSSYSERLNPVVAKVNKSVAHTFHARRHVYLTLSASYIDYLALPPCPGTPSREYSTRCRDLLIWESSSHRSPWEQRVLHELG